MIKIVNTELIIVVAWFNANEIFLNIEKILHDI